MGIFSKIHDRLVVHQSSAEGKYKEADCSVQKKKVAEVTKSNDPFLMNAKDVRIDSFFSRTVANGSDKYQVDDVHYSFVATSYGEKLEQTVREFVVSGVEKQESLRVVARKGYTLFEKDMAPCDDIFLCFDGRVLALKDYPLNRSVDLDNVNSIRYELEASIEDEKGTYPSHTVQEGNLLRKKAMHFLDKFVIVTSDERMTYKAYARERDRELREKMNMQQKIQNIKNRNLER